MNPETAAIWKQFEETYAAIREALDAVPEEKLHWEPAAGCSSVADILQHIARANLRYCRVIEQTQQNLEDPRAQPNRQELLAMLERSAGAVKTVFQSLTDEHARAPRAADWHPLGPRVEGPLDGIWFALQIVRHSAYHLGQINYVMQLGGFAIEYD